MQHRVSDSRGFTLVEMAIVVLVLGIVIAMGVGGVMAVAKDNQLRDTARGVAGQIVLARSRAMATGTTSIVNFDAGSTPQRIYVVGPNFSHYWALPRDVRYATGTATTLNMTNDGRASASSYVVLQNTKGLKDTVSIQTSGLVIAR